MAPVHTTNAGDSENVRLLLTGFGAFGGIVDNPSTLAGRLLDSEVLTTLPEPLPKATSQPRVDSKVDQLDSSDLHDVIAASVDISHVGRSIPEPSETSVCPTALPTTSVPVSITFQPVVVTYEEVLRRVPDWHKSGQWDAIVHVGVAAGYPGVAIESGSDRLGYSMTFPDAGGEFPPPVEGGNGVEGRVDRWNTIVDTAGLLSQQRDAMGFKSTFASTNPGGYLCGFIYAASLKWSVIVAEYEQRQPIPVVFIHVPTASDDERTPGPYTIEHLAKYLRAVCWFVGQHGAKVRK